jgi:hypothetical protein
MRSLAASPTCTALCLMAPRDRLQTLLNIGACGFYRWVTAAGGQVEAAEGVEVSPTVSYAGEGLDDICKGRTFTQPLDAALQV